MRTHFERVSSLKEYAGCRKQKVKTEHTASLILIFVLLSGSVFLGAALPDVYVWFDSTSPWLQLAIVLIPMVVFTVWRLKKML